MSHQTLLAAMRPPVSYDTVGETAEIKAEAGVFDIVADHAEGVKMRRSLMRKTITCTAGKSCSPSLRPPEPIPNNVLMPCWPSSMPWAV